MEKYGYPPVQTPIRERRPTYHVSTRSRMKYLCLFTASFMLLFWHLSKVPRYTPILLAAHSETLNPLLLDTSKWKTYTKEDDDGTWKVPLEAHIMFVFPHHLPTTLTKLHTNPRIGPNAPTP